MEMTSTKEVGLETEASKKIVEIQGKAEKQEWGETMSKGRYKCYTETTPTENLRMGTNLKDTRTFHLMLKFILKIIK